MCVYDVWSKQWSIAVDRTVLCFNLYGNVKLYGTWLVVFCDPVVSVADYYRHL